jgi:hypothetical protein
VAFAFGKSLNHCDCPPCTHVPDSASLKKGFFMKNLHKLGIAALTLAIVFSFAACGNPASSGDSDGGGSDTWSKVTSLEQVNGTWKGSYSMTDTMKEYLASDWDTYKDTLGEDMKITISGQVTLTIDANAGAFTETHTDTLSFTGSKISTAWGTIKGYFGSTDIYYNDSKHTATFTETSPYSGTIDIASLEINQNGTKIRLSEGAIGSGSPEMILTKQ